MNDKTKSASSLTSNTGRNIKQLVNESPKSTVKVAPVEKGDKGTESELGRFKTEMKVLLKEFSDNITSRMDEMEAKFTGMFKDYQNDMEVIRQDVTDTKREVIDIKGKMDDITEKVEKIDGIETSLEFHSNELEDVKEKQKEKFIETRQYIDDKVTELNNKLQLLEKQDRKYNLIAYGIPEDNDENVCDKMREIFRNDLKISPHRVDNMYFAHGHRMPSKKKEAPRPIIVRFTSYGDRDLVLANAKKLAGTKRRIVTDLPVPMKEVRGVLAKEAFKIRHDEKLQTRIKERGLTVSLEVRKDESQPWVKRM